MLVLLVLSLLVHCQSLLLNSRQVKIMIKVKRINHIHQPLVVALYPVTKYGNKDRSFNSSWYSKYNWLEYFIRLDAAFCYPCRFFAHGSSKAEDRFVTLGYRDWKHASGQTGTANVNITKMQ